MTLQYVGGKSGSFAGATSGNTSVDLSSGLTGGIGVAVQPGDVVVIDYVTGSTTDRTLSIADPGAAAYTLIGSELYAAGSTYKTNLRAALKAMPYDSPADGTVVLGPTGATADGGAYAVHVWRGADISTPLDVTPATATGTGTGLADPPAITPTTAGAKVVVAAGGAAATGTTNYTSSDLSNIQQANRAATNDGRAFLGSADWTSGAFNPAQFGGFSSNAANSWAAISLALRPRAWGAVEVLGASWNEGADSCVVDKPDGTTDGERLLMCISSEAAPSTPSGWTAGPSYNSGGPLGRVSWFYKTAASEGPTYTATATGGGLAAIVFRMGGAKTSASPFGGSASNSGNSGTRSAGNLTATDAASLMLAMSNGYDVISGTPAGWGAIPNAGDTYLWVFAKDTGAAGSVGSWSQSQGSSTYWIAHTVEILPEPGASSDDLTASGISSSPAVGSPAISQNHGLASPAVATSAPSVGSPALGQNHGLTATGITASPVVGTPTAAIVSNLAADGLDSGGPSVGSPGIAQVHALTPSDVGPTAPAVGSPTLAQTHALAADGPTASPAVGSPTLGQVHALTASSIALGVPSLGTPTLGQTHALAATGISTGPQIETPTAAEGDIYPVDSLTSGNPSVGTPALGQAHALASPGVTASPTVGSPSLSQNYVLGASGLDLDPPSVGSPAIAQAHALDALGVDLGPPAPGSPAIAQAHALGAVGIATAAPSVGSPTTGEGYALDASNLDVGQPVSGNPTLGQVHGLAPGAVALGVPSVGSPALSQNHALAAPELATPAPTTGAPQISQVHALAAGELLAGAVVMGSPSLDLLLVSSDDRRLTIEAYSRLVTIPAGDVRSISIEAVLRSILALPNRK